MIKKDWKDKEKVFLDMLDKANTNKNNVENQIEELNLFLDAIKQKIKTFK